MIKASEANFQFNSSSPADWCETNYFSFYIPSDGIFSALYLLSRPVLGVAMSDITVQDRIAVAWEDQLYVDNQQHLQCPQSLLDYNLSNGLSVKAVEPLKRYDISYKGIDDTEIAIEFEALMDPFDMNDPDMDPLASDRIGKAWGGAALSGHYEITGRIRGEARLRGQSYKIDCIDTLDRSWGARKERDNDSVIWLHGSFGEKLTIHAFFRYDPLSAGFGKLVSGYILENGNVYGLVNGRGSAKRLGILPLSNVVEITDIRGKTFQFTSSAVNASSYSPFPSTPYPQSFMRCNYEGTIGWGVQMDVISRNFLTRNRDRLLRS